MPSPAKARGLRWAIELGQFNVNFCPRTVIKGQALADLIAKFTYVSTAEVARTTANTKVAKLVEARNNKGSALPQEETQ